MKDRRDFNSYQSRWDEWARLRNKAANLSDSRFKASIRAIEAILDHAYEDSKKQEESSSMSATSVPAKHLYDASKEDSEDR